MKVQQRNNTENLLTIVWAAAAIVIVSVVARFPGEFSGSSSFQDLVAVATSDPWALLIVVPVMAILIACGLAMIGNRRAGVHIMLFAVIALLPLAGLITLTALWMFAIIGLFGGYPGAAPPGGPPGSTLELQLVLLGNYSSFLHIALAAYLFWVAFVVTICETRRGRAQVESAIS